MSKISEEALALLAGKGVSGKAFFEVATQALTIGLGSKVAGIARWLDGHQSVELLALAINGKSVDTFSYPVQGTPCRQVYDLADAKRSECFIGSGLCEQFPDDAILRELEAESFRGELFFDPDGNPVGHVMVLDDKPMVNAPQDVALFRLVTQRVGAEFNRWRTELALQESQEKLRRAADLANLGYWEWDEVEDRASYCSDEFAHIYGFDSGAELASLLSSEAEFVKFVHPEDREHYQAVMYESIKSKRPFQIELRVLARNGEVRVVQEMGAPSVDKHGTLIRTSGVVQDITEKTRAREVVKETEARFQAIADHTPALLALKDLEGRYVFVNKQFERIHGTPAEWFIGKTAGDVLPADMAVLSDAHDQEVLERLCVVEKEQWTPSGEGPRLLMELKFPVFDAEGKPVALGLIGTDMTERKEAEVALLEAKEQAEQATRAKSQYLANMSHELRTPLNAIIGITEMLYEDAENEGQAELIEPLARIARAGKHLLSLINDVLDLSKIEAGKFELNPEAIDINQLINELEMTAQPLAEQNRNTLTVRCPADIGTTRADPLRVRQVILNLLSNACKFTEDGEVALDVSRERSDGEDRVCFTVSDTGVGIDPDEIDKLFQEFAQADTSSRRYGGTGLGLAISQRLCRLMDGEIKASSTPRSGSTFSVWLPIRK